MHHYRQALMRMRQGDSDRDLARSGLMGRRTAAALRMLAGEQGWLDSQHPLPEDATIADALASPKRASTTISHLEPLREQIAGWHAQGVSGVVILAALKPAFAIHADTAVRVGSVRSVRTGRVAVSSVA